MNIGITVDGGTGLDSMVSDKFETCKYLLIARIDDCAPFGTIHVMETTALDNPGGQEGIELAKELMTYDCEALITGELGPATFDMIADACITRYNGVGHSAMEALEYMEKRMLKLIRNLEGTDECDDSHHHHH